MTSTDGSNPVKAGRQEATCAGRNDGDEIVCGQRTDPSADTADTTRLAYCRSHRCCRSMRTQEADCADRKRGDVVAGIRQRHGIGGRQQYRAERLILRDGQRQQVVGCADDVEPRPPTPRCLSRNGSDAGAVRERNGVRARDATPVPRRALRGRQRKNVVRYIDDVDAARTQQTQLLCKHADGTAGVEQRHGTPSQWTTRSRSARPPAPS